RAPSSPSRPCRNRRSKQRRPRFRSLCCRPACQPRHDPRGFGPRGLGPAKGLAAAPTPGSRPPKISRSRAPFSTSSLGDFGFHVSTLCVSTFGVLALRASALGVVTPPGFFRRGLGHGRSSEDAREDRVGVLEVIADVEFGVDLLLGEVSAHLRVFRKKGAEIAFTT